MPFATLHDLTLHYELVGPEHGPTLIFSNSLGTTFRMWDAQLEQFKSHFRILRYDTRGHGKSSVTPGPYTIERLAEDVTQLMDHLRIETAAFCGLSMGGMIGMQLGATAPTRFHKIVLCNTAAKIGTLETWNTRIATVVAGGMKSVASSVLERWLTAGYRESHPQEANEALAMLESASPEGYVANCAAVRDFDFRARLGEIRSRVLIVAGTHDPVTPPADGRFIQRHIAGAHYTELSAAHVSNIEAHDAFNNAVLGFLL